MEDGLKDGLEGEEKSAVVYRASELIRVARVAAGMDIAKISAALRISPAALEALEAGQYDRLPGEPYVRALLGSVARYLGMDAAKVLQTYNSEIGTKSEEPVARPYQDDSKLHILAHKKWFIAVLVILLAALLFIFGKINSSSSDKGDMAVDTTPRADSASSLATPPADSTTESKSLQPDSLNGKLDSTVKVATKRDTNHVMVVAKIDTAHKIAKATPVKHDSAAKTPAAASAPLMTPLATSAGMNRISVKPLMDSVWMRVLRKGKPEEVILLRTSNPPVDVAHTDTITLILGKRLGVEVALGDTTFVPTKKRFKLIGKKIIYF